MTARSLLCSALLLTLSFSSACSGTASGITVATSSTSSGSTAGGTTGCSSRCTEGETQCVGAAQQTCVRGGLGCSVWSAPQSCGGGNVCQGSACKAGNGTAGTGGTTGGPTCSNVCPSQGATRCSGDLVQSCAKLGNGCQEWAAAVSCPSGETCDTKISACDGGSGNPICSDGCPKIGAAQCQGSQVELCQRAATGCLAWSTAVNCPTGRACDSNSNSCALQGNSTTGGTSASPTGGSTGTGGGTSGSGSTTGSSCDQCTDQSTQCSGNQVQTCALGSDGCEEWQAAVDCPTGQLCDPTLQACNDQCSVASVASSCEQAAQTENACCGASFTLTGNQVCQADPNASTNCPLVPTETCGQISSYWQSEGECCCATAGQTCDQETANFDCFASCLSGADCASQTTRTACAPNDNGGVLVDGPWLCKPDDGAAYHGCNGAFTGCDTGFDCWSTSYGDICTTSCTVDSDCGEPGVACCLTSSTVSCAETLGSCGGLPGACAPCGS